MNNGIKVGLIIIGISILGFAFFTISGREMPSFFTRFMIMGVVITALGVYAIFAEKKDKNDERRLRK